jgi:hypothetical protein
MKRLAGSYQILNNEGQEIGWEEFDIESMPDGGDLLRSRCRLVAPQVARDVIYAVDADRRPIDCTIRTSVGDAASSSAWFAFSERGVACELTCPRLGRVSQTHGRSGRPRSFGTHALVNDGWHAALYDHAAGGVQSFADCPVSAVSETGETSLLAEYVRVQLEFAGNEHIEAPVGMFTAGHYRLGFARYAPIDIWVRSSDGLLVKMIWSQTGADIRLTRLD